MTETDHERLRTMLTISALIAALGLFIACSGIEAAELLPNGMTCADVQRVAAEHQVQNDTRWTRVRARAIALSYGYSLSRTQIDTAFKCLRKD